MLSGKGKKGESRLFSIGQRGEGGGGGYLTFYKEVFGGGVSSFRYILYVIHFPRWVRQ